jgi:hypothetical protein
VGDLVTTRTILDRCPRSSLCADLVIDHTAEDFAEAVVLADDDANSMTGCTNAQLFKSCEVRASVGSNPTPSAERSRASSQRSVTAGPQIGH